MEAVQPSSSALGLSDAPKMFVSPGAVFARIAQDARYGWALGALLLLTALIGWATVQTALIDRQVNMQTQRSLANLEREQIDLLTRAELSERLDNIRKTAEFQKLMARGGVMLATPLTLVASVMLIAAMWFAVVALTGHKPDYPTLMAICVYSAVIDVLAQMLRLALMLYYRTMEVDTSLGLLVADQSSPLHGVLSAIDPFRTWFWVLAALGLVITGQLTRRAAIVTCVLFWLIATGVRMIPMPTGGALG